MNVICKKPNKSTVKGATYRVLLLRNKPDPSDRFFRPRIVIEISSGVHASYTPKSFTLNDGKPIPEINYQATDFQTTNWNDGLIDVNIKKGDYVTYRFGSSKLMERDKIYRLEDVLIRQIVNGNYKYTDIKLKIEGNPRWISSHSFRKLSDQQTRDINLSKLFDQDVPVSKIDKTVRKFDRIPKEEQMRILVSTLVNSMLDNTRNNMSVIEWASEKFGKLYGIKTEDYEPVLKVSLKTLMKKFE